MLELISFRSKPILPAEPAWNRLHAMSKEKTECIEKNYVMNYRQKLQEELSSCTFTPQITEYSKHQNQDTQETFYERSKAWKGELSKRIESERANFLQDEKRICSFTPDLNSKTRLIGEEADIAIPKIYNESAIRKHIERHLVAQFEKFVKDTILSKGRPPKKNVAKLVKSLSAQKVARSTSKSGRNKSTDKTAKKSKSKKRRRKTNQSQALLNADNSRKSNAELSNIFR